MNHGTGRRARPDPADSAPQQLRPLFLPFPRNAWKPPDDSEPAETTVEVHVPENEIPAYKVFGVEPVDAQSVFWYRWIVGHQISFSLWRAMYEIVREHDDTPPSPAEVDALTACVDAYSAMLLYSSTVPRTHYHSHIRQRMSLQHPAFSGTWAPDYRPVRRLIRGRMPWQSEPVCRALADAVARNAATHDYIADHLVPDGRSLLQEAAQSGESVVSEEREELYDNFFLTIRRPITRATFLNQLRVRVTGVGVDLARHGLYPNVDGHHHPVVTGPAGGSVMTLVPGALRVVDEAARQVASPRRERVTA